MKPLHPKFTKSPRAVINSELGLLHPDLWGHADGAGSSGAGEGGRRRNVLGVRWGTDRGEESVRGFCCSHNTCLLCSALQCNINGFSVPLGGKKAVHLLVLSCLRISVQLQCPEGGRKEHEIPGKV